MNKPWLVWFSLALSALMIFGVLGWMTNRSLHGERERIEAQVRADYHERIRLALSRMDTLGASLLVLENQRPPLQFQSFYEPGDLFRADSSQVAETELRQPSPLLIEDNETVRLYFEIAENGQITSPQVPPGSLRELALGADVSEDKLQNSTQTLGQFRQLLSPANRVELTRAPLQEPAQSTWSNQTDDLLRNRANVSPKDIKVYEEKLDQQEYAGRFSTLNKATEKAKMRSETVARQQQVLKRIPSEPAKSNSPSKKALSSTLINLSLFQPRWLDQELFLIRKVTGNRSSKYQGIWLNQEALLDDFQQELPKDLSGVKIAAHIDGQPSRFSLASLPYHLIPGEISALDDLPLGSLKRSLTVAWIAALIAVLALAFMLFKVLQLSERRAAFVSAVTHELRTPLTTFRLYSEMLVDGMVPDEATRQDYLETMKSESDRLNHLIENVLSYSQMERGTARSRFDRVTVASLLERLRPLLLRRAEQDEVKLTIIDEASTEEIETDLTAVEQILFNLVDNACKYGKPSHGEATITLTAKMSKNSVAFEVQDNGKGVLGSEARRLFRPFHKSALEAARSQPGVGLGLALCRRLAKALQGELALAKSETGACFTLRLPLHCRTSKKG